MTFDPNKEVADFLEGTLEILGELGEGDPAFAKALADLKSRVAPDIENIRAGQFEKELEEWDSPLHRWEIDRWKEAIRNLDESG